MKYYIKLDEETLGPFSVEQIKRDIAERAYHESDIVRPEDSNDWVTLDSLPEFADEFKPQPIGRNRLVETSLILAIASLLMLVLAVALALNDAAPIWLILLLFGTYFTLGIGAIRLGHMAISWIKCSLFKVKGIGMARSGLTLGYIMIFVPLAIFILPAFMHDCEDGPIPKAINNCKQIGISLRLYSGDHEGKYPDAILPNATTSNEVFRALFKEDILETEKIFGCGKSPYVPDGNIGIAPDFLEAVKAGENHWAMTKGATDSLDSRIPLVFENPSEATWPPKWNANLTGAQPGRAWAKGKVVIGFNDGSVEVLPLESEKGESVGLKPYPDGTPVFPMNHPGLEILNVAK